MLSREGRPQTGRRSRAEIAATLAIPTRACVERLVTNRPRGTARPRDGNGGTGGWRARGSPSKPATLINADASACDRVRTARPKFGARGSFSASRSWPTASARNSATTKTAGQGISGDDRNVVEFPIGHSAPAKDIVPLRKSWRCPNADHAPGNTATARHRTTYAFPSGDLLFQSYSTRRNSSLTSLAHDADEGDGLFRMMRFCRVG
jgi:hypothetical protein